MDHSPEQLALLENLSAISATFHGGLDRYNAFYDNHAVRLNGFPGIWAYMIELAEAFTTAETQWLESHGEWDGPNWPLPPLKKQGGNIMAQADEIKAALIEIVIEIDKFGGITFKADNRNSVMDVTLKRFGEEFVEACKAFCRELRLARQRKAELKKQQAVRLSYWDLSTGHITESDAAILGACGEDPGSGLIVHAYAEGYFIPVTDFGAPEELNLSPEFMSIYMRAQDSGVSLIRLDADGQVVEGMKVFDW